MISVVILSETLIWSDPRGFSGPAAGFDSGPHGEFSGSHQRGKRNRVWFNVTWRYYRALATTQRPLHRCTVGTDVSSHELRKHFHMFRPEQIAAPARLQI